MRKKSQERVPRPTELILPTGWWDKQETHALSLNERIKCTFSSDTNWYLSPDKRVTIVSPSCSNDICYTGVPSQEERTLNKTLFVNISKHPFLWTNSGTRCLKKHIQIPGRFHPERESAPIHQKPGAQQNGPHDRIPC